LSILAWQVHTVGTVVVVVVVVVVVFVTQAGWPAHFGPEQSFSDAQTKA